MPDWFEKRTFGSLPDEMALRHGHREALYFQGQRWSFAQVAAEIDRVAKGLMQLGVQPGEKVGLWVTNRPEWLFCMYAVFKIGAVLVPINTRLRTEDIRYILSQSNSGTLVTVERSGPVNYFEMVQELLPELAGAKERVLRSQDFPDLRRVIVSGAQRFAGTFAWDELLQGGTAIDDAALARRAAAVAPDDTAFIMYTSGTTGFPKGVMRNHNLVRNVTDQANRMAITPRDVLLNNLPLFHVFSLTNCALMSMLTGARQVLTEAFDAEESLDLIAQERVTYLQGVDTQFQDLVLAQGRRPRDLSSIRTGIFAAGMASSTPVAYQADEAIGPMLSAFGMTECGVGASLSFLTDSAEQRCEASGYPLPGYTFRVLDPETGREQPAGTPGELQVSGYAVMQGYYNKPEETAKAVDAQGWLHTGDMAVIRADGHIRFMGRYKDMLRTGGENVDPMEVEGFLLQHPGVHQAAVVGYPDRRLVEVGVAFIQRKPGQAVSEAELLDYCRGKIASYKIPRHVMFVDAFPMTGSGKIQKVKLRAAALERLPPPATG
ncbi:MAG: AMP-binding protein [Candidatus Lambdaproteobacteria bacterium]|nr:AMP-binding protein [Candidatus Lambdaproteobacteria bacterium]